MILIGLLAIFIGYLYFLAYRLGLPHRLSLAFGPISLDKISERAAKKYGDDPLFTCDRPCAWSIKALQKRNPDTQQWSAAAIEATTGHLARTWRQKLHLNDLERVAILKQNHFDIHLFTHSVVRAGGVACPINGNFASKDVQPYLSNIGARILITDSPTLERLIKANVSFGDVTRIVIAEKRRSAPASEPYDFDRCPLLKTTKAIVWLKELTEGIDETVKLPPRGKEEPFYLVHSSGTTGFPKAVILKNGAQSHAVRGVFCYVQLSRKLDKGYVAVPNNHQAVINAFNALLLMGLRTHWNSAFDHKDFNAVKVVEELGEGGFTGYFGFPVTYTLLKEVSLENYRLSKMKFWASTADASHEVIQKKFSSTGNAFKHLGIPISGSVYLDIQGSSEVGTPSVIRYITPLTKKFDRRVGTPGTMLFFPKVRIRKATGELAKRGEVGRLEVKGKTVFEGYWNNHTTYYQAAKDRWFFTGDVVRLEKDGNLIQLDREVDVIHTSNGDVYSLPIEEKVHKHPSVFDACVYGAFQEDGSQLPAVAIALRKGTTITAVELLTELNKALPEPEKLNSCTIMDWKDFPIGVTGKTLKRVFRENSRKSSGITARTNGTVAGTVSLPA